MLQSMLVPFLTAVIVLMAWIFFMLPALQRAKPATKEIVEPIQIKKTNVNVALIGGVVLAGITWQISRNPSLAFAMFVVWYGANVIVLSRIQQKRTQREEQYAIEAIGGASRSLRAGIPMSGMLHILALESRGETQAAFRQIVQRESMGEELVLAVRRVLLQSPLASLRAFGLALIIQVAAGGNLADTTDRLARSLIDLERVRRRAKTIVAYSRAAATVFVLLPMIVVPLMCTLIDGYREFLLDGKSGNAILGFSIILLVLGLVMIQRFSRIESLREWKPS
jgi:Flp pilus assembly protein TadB